MSKATAASRWGKSEAFKGLEEAKKLLKEHNYESAKECMDYAFQLAPDVAHGLAMLTACQTLYYGNKPFPNLGMDWYSVLHLHPSVNISEVETQFDILTKHASSLVKFRMPAINQGCHSVLKQAVSVFRCESTRLEFDNKRKQFGLIDIPIESNGGTFEERYMKWKPPIVPLVVDDDDINPPQLPFSSRKRARIDSSLPPGFNCLEELNKLKNQIFSEMPQNPHYAPLEKYNKNILQGMVFGLDVVLIKLYEEVRKLDHPQTLWSKLGGFTEQLATLEEMGYNVVKLRQRLDALKSTAELDRESKRTVMHFEIHVREIENRIKEHEKNIQGLLAEHDKRIQDLKLEHDNKVQVLKAEHDKNIKEHVSKIHELKTEIDKRGRKLDHLKMESNKILKEFASIAKSKLK